MCDANNGNSMVTNNGKIISKSLHYRIVVENYICGNEFIKPFLLIPATKPDATPPSTDTKPVKSKQKYNSSNT